MEDDHQIDEVGGRTEPGEDAERALREALARIDQVDDVQQRFLSQARRQVSELHVEATRVRAAALETARKVVADAEAEAASVLEAAREEAARLRAASELEVKAHAEVLLAVAHKERDELMAAASAEADRLREEAALTGESLLNTAQTKAVALVQQAKEEAARIGAASGGGGGQAPGSRLATADELRGDQGAPRAGSDDGGTEADLRRLHEEVDALAGELGKALEGLADRIAATDGLAAQIAVSAGRTFATHRTPAPLDLTEPPAPPAAPACGDPVPLIGSRGNQGASSAHPSSVAPGSAAPPSHAAPDSEPHARDGGPAGRGSHWDHSLDWPRTRRGPGWRRRGA